MSPGDEKGRPGKDGHLETQRYATIVPTDADVARWLPPFTPSPARRLRDDIERRWASREFDAICARLYPAPPPRIPQTFGLTEAELRRHGNALVASGWREAEVLEVLAIPERVGAGR